MLTLAFWLVLACELGGELVRACEWAWRYTLGWRLVLVSWLVEVLGIRCVWMSVSALGRASVRGCEWELRCESGSGLGLEFLLEGLLGSPNALRSGLSLGSMIRWGLWSACWSGFRWVFPLGSLLAFRLEFQSRLGYRSERSCVLVWALVYASEWGLTSALLYELVMRWVSSLGPSLALEFSSAL